MESILLWNGIGWNNCRNFRLCFVERALKGSNVRIKSDYINLRIKNKK